MIYTILSNTCLMAKQRHITLYKWIVLSISHQSSAYTLHIGQYLIKYIDLDKQSWYKIKCYKSTYTHVKLINIPACTLKKMHLQHFDINMADRVSIFWYILDLNILLYFLIYYITWFDFSCSCRWSCWRERTWKICKSKT